MYRHYQGNSGQSRRIEEPAKKRGEFHGRALAPLPAKGESSGKHPGEKQRGKPHYEAPPSSLSGLSGELGKIFGKLGSLSLETEDILLIAVLYLMYRESGDKELLIMIGALLFL